MASKKFKMVQECCDSYKMEPLPNGHTQITIKVSPRFADLWLVKMSELEVSEDEIKEYEPSKSDER